MPKLSKAQDRGWRDWYQLERWRKRAKHQLRIEPLCRYCRARGVVQPATIADHIQPHNGDPNAFWLGELQSLCKDCHDSAKRLEQDRGFRSDVGLDGVPLDPRHPAHGTNRSEAATTCAIRKEKILL
jgi:hypothetical protein